MSPAIATVAYGIGILSLFALDQDPDSRPSRALWLPVLWLLIEASRPVSYWLQMAPPSSGSAYLEGSPLDRNVFLSLSIIGLIVLIARAHQVSTLLRANRAILLFFLYCGVSVLWSDYSDVAFRRWIKALGELVMVFIVLTDPHPVAAIKRLLARAGFLLLPLSILLIKYYGDLGRNYRPGDFGSMWNTTNIGVTTDKNALGMIAMIFGLGALWQLVKLRQSSGAPRRWKRIAAQGMLLVTAFWIFRTANSMTSLSCFVLGATLLILTSFWRFFRRPAVLATVVIAALCLSLFAVFIAPNLLSALGRDPTLTGRTEIWNLVLGMTGNPLLGTGFESFWLGSRLQAMWSIYWWHPNEAHNGYIEIYLDLGWMGVALLAVLLLTGLRNTLTAVRQQAEAGGLMLAYFVVVLIYNFTESAFRQLDPIWFVLLLSAIAVQESSVVFEIDQVEDLAEEPENEFRDLVQADSLKGAT
jgi:exopolysaccharide production protein ExoQ